MEKQKQPIHRCSVCRYYTPFYIKKDTCFERINNGYCKECCQIEDHNNTCDKWESKPYWYYSRKYTTERVLRDLTAHLMAISKILQEEKDETDKNRR